MIGRLVGRVDYRAVDHVLLDVRGVGYLVYCSERTLAALPREGEATALYTDLHVRDDLLQLYGFASRAEKEWHRLLIGVQGVGAKASLAILGALGPEGVGRAVALGDWTTVKAIKGVGIKTAQRVVNELKDKMPEILAIGAAASAPASVAEDSKEEEPPMAAALPALAPVGPKDSADGAAEALSALNNLGYTSGEAAAAVAQAAAETPEADTSALIRAALKLLAPKE